MVSKEGSAELQDERIVQNQTNGDRHITAGGRVAERTVVLVFRARASMAEERVYGLEDTVVVEIIKGAPSRGGSLDVAKPAVWVGRVLPLLENYHTGRFENVRRRTRKGIGSYRAIVPTLLKSMLYTMCINFPVVKAKKNLNAGSSCT